MNFLKPTIFLWILEQRNLSLRFTRIRINEVSRERSDNPCRYPLNIFLRELWLFENGWLVDRFLYCLSLSLCSSFRILIFLLLLLLARRSTRHLLIKSSQFNLQIQQRRSDRRENSFHRRKRDEGGGEGEGEEEAIQTVVTFGESIKPIKGCPFRRKSRKSGCVHT